LLDDRLGFGGIDDREIEVKHGAGLGLAFDDDDALVVDHDAVHDGETKAGAFARLFGRKERFENPFARGGIHAAAGVAHRKAHGAAGPQLRVLRDHGALDLDRPQGHRQHPADGAHGIGGVGAEVHENLVHLGGIAKDRRAVVVDVEADVDGGGQRGAQQAQRLLDHGAEPGDDALLLAAAAEGQDLRHEIPGPVAGFERFRKVGARGMSVRQVELGELHVARDAVRMLLKSCAMPPASVPMALHLLRLVQLHLEVFACFLGAFARGDVLDDGEQAVLAVERQQTERDEEGDRFAALIGGPMLERVAGPRSRACRTRWRRSSGLENTPRATVSRPITSSRA